MPKNITVIGDANMDMVIGADRFPKTGETLNGRGFCLSPGGKGANQAAACARLCAGTGIKTRFIACVGNDDFGASVIKSLERLGVDAGCVEVCERNTGVAVITVSGGENTIVVDSGANRMLGPEIIRKHRETILSSDAAVLQLGIPIETNLEIIELCKGRVPVFLNPAPAAPLSPEALSGIFCFTPNETEAPLYTGIKIETVNDALASLDVLKKMGIKHPVITLGTNGAVYNDGTENIHIKAYNVTPLDSTAAGDVFTGALAFAITSGKPFGEAAAFANAAAAISVTRPGAQNSVPALSEVEEMIKKGRL